MQVSNEGEILYVFRPGFKGALQGRSLLLRLEPAVAAVKAGAAYLARVAFGTALITSGERGGEQGNRKVRWVCTLCGPVLTCLSGLGSSRHQGRPALSLL